MRVDAPCSPPTPGVSVMRFACWLPYFACSIHRKNKMPDMHRCAGLNGHADRQGRLGPARHAGEERCQGTDTTAVVDVRGGVWCWIVIVVLTAVKPVYVALWKKMFFVRKQAYLLTVVLCPRSQKAEFYAVDLRLYWWSSILVRLVRLRLPVNVLIIFILIIHW